MCIDHNIPSVRIICMRFYGWGLVKEYLDYKYNVQTLQCIEIL